jgi:drug/metabolite transporter (DMT)-like permease
MPPLIAPLVVASALLHALWNAALKRQADPEGASVAILAVAAIMSGAALLLPGGPGFPIASGFGWALAAGVCEGGYFVTLALALRQAPFGVVYPIARGGALALVWPASVLWLGEAITARTGAGVVLLTLGLVLVGREGRDRATLRGVAWAVLCASAVAGYHLCYKLALDTGASPGAVFAVALAVALPVAVGRLGRGALGRTLLAWRASPLVVSVAGVLCAVSFLVFLSALARGGAGAAVTLRNTSVLFALLLAWAIGERPRRPQVIGTMGVAFGAVLMGWPP